MGWRVIGEDEIEEGEGFLSSLFSSEITTQLYKKYNLVKKASIARINKTLFFPKLKPIAHYPNNVILELESQTENLQITEDALVASKISSNKLIVKDTNETEHQVELIKLKNVLDNSDII
ncbi:MAG: hypothetical protein CL512_05585 [Actinobacteria bacterium]|nr:hypothetical protein [Actinomycetota bacterium]|tara:strand:- start:189 stop:548 length:360 start_codon:yes stop_codon:yes gene_type:complete